MKDVDTHFEKKKKYVCAFCLLNIEELVFSARHKLLLVEPFLFAGQQP